MALINCPECEKQISDQTKSCPNCGYPIKKRIIEWDITKENIKNEANADENGVVWNVLGSLILVFLIVIIIGVNKCSDNESILHSGRQLQENNITPVIKIKYLKESLNVREKPTVESKILKTLGPNQEVRTKGIEENGFTQILDLENQIYGWCSSKHLQDKPLAKEEGQRTKIKEEVLNDTKQYIRLTEDSINIRHAPNLNSSTVALGMKGDVFDLHKTEDNWFVVFMFSGEYRYINIASAEKVDSITPYSFPIEIKKKVFKEVYEVEGAINKWATK